MKPINFIDSIPPHTQTAVVRWYRHTIFALTTLLVTVGSVSLYQLYVIHTLQPKKSSAQTIQRYQAAQQELAVLHAQHKKLQKTQELARKLTRNNRVYSTCMQHLHTTIDKQAPIASCTLSPTTMSCTLHCRDVATTQELVTQLRALPAVESLRISTLRPGTYNNTATTMLCVNGKLSLQT